MRGQASRGVWQAARAPPPLAVSSLSQLEDIEFRRYPDCGVSGVVRGVGNVRNRTREAGVGSGRGRGGGSGDGVGMGGTRKFQLAADHDMAAAAAGDGLSDSESEDEEDDTPIPTPADARTAFDDSAMGSSRGSGQPLHDGSEGTGGEVGTGAAGVVRAEGVAGAEISRPKGLERELAMSALEDARRKTRKSDAERLANRMGAIGAQVRTLELREETLLPKPLVRPEAEAKRHSSPCKLDETCSM